MSTVDLDAIRERYERAQQLLSRSYYHPAAVRARLAHSAADVPALLAEVDVLRFLCAEARVERDEARTTAESMTLSLKRSHAETQEIAAELAQERTLHQQTLAEVERLRTDLAETERQRDNHYREFYATQSELWQRLAEVTTMREVARSNKRHVATLTAILERVEALTVSTDGDDLDADAEIPVGEIRRALTEPLPHEAAFTGGDSADGTS